MNLGTIISMVVATLVGFVGVFTASNYPACSRPYNVGLTTFVGAILFDFLLIKWHFDTEEGLITTTANMQRVAAIFTTTILALLLYQYVVAQWDTVVKPEWNIIFPTAIVFFVTLAAVLSCLETSLTNIHKLDLDDWLIAKTASVLDVAGTGPLDEALQDRIRRYKRIQQIHRDLIDDDRRREDHATFLIALITVTDVALTVLYARALLDLKEFSPEAPVLFAEWWPFGGASGFVSVGVALLLLFFAGILPNKIAMRKTVGCFMSLSWIIRVCNQLHIAPAVVFGLVIPIDMALNLMNIREKKV